MAKKIEQKANFARFWLWLLEAHVCCLVVFFDEYIIEVDVSRGE